MNTIIPTLVASTILAASDSTDISDATIEVTESPEVTESDVLDGVEALTSDVTAPETTSTDDVATSTDDSRETAAIDPSTDPGLKTPAADKKAPKAKAARAPKEPKAPKAPRAPKAPKEKHVYPFQSKAEIRQLLVSDAAFAESSMVILFNLQTSSEQANGQTQVKNRAGFMSSHSVKGSAVAKKIISGEALTDEDRATIATIAPHYSKQISCFLRDEAIRSNPALAREAQVFGLKV